MYKYVLGLFLLLLAAPVSAQAATTVNWLVPASATINCSAHTNCFNNKRTVKLAINSASNLKQIDFEARIAGSAVWKNVHSDSTLAGQSIPNYSVTIDFAQALATSNVDFELKAIVTDVNNVRTTSGLVNMRLDSKLPQITVATAGSAVGFSNNPLQLVQGFTLQEPAGTGNIGSGLQRMFFRIYRNVDAQTGQRPVASGIEGYVNNLPATAQVVAAFNWSNVLPEGYYWIEYRLDDHSITSEDSNANATQFNAAYANCPASNSGNICKHISGQSFEAHYFPFVIDTNPPALNNLKFNGSASPSSVSGPVTISFELTDNFSWVKSGSVFVNNVESVLPVSGQNKVILPSVTIPASQFINGDNTIKICGTDFAGNSMCSQTVINANNPTAPVVTTSWTATTNYLTANFVSKVLPSGTLITSYSWNFGDGKTGTGANPAHVYTSAGTYPVTLTVVPSGGSAVSYTANITVTAQPVNNGGTTTGNGGNNNSGGNNSGGGNNNGGGHGTIITAGSNTNKGQVAGQSTTKVDDEFYFLDPPPVVVYVGDPVTPHLFVSDSLKIQNYLWQYGNRREQTTTEPTHTFSYKEPGTYTLTLSARDSSGVEHIATLQIEVRAKQSNSDKESIVSQNTTPARINFQGLVDFARQYPYFCCSFLLIFIVLLLLLLRRRKKTQEAEEESRPLIADRIKIPTNK